MGTSNVLQIMDSAQCNINVSLLVANISFPAIWIYNVLNYKGMLNTERHIDGLAMLLLICEAQDSNLDQEAGNSN
jgi:hypothetical protein